MSRILSFSLFALFLFTVASRVSECQAGHIMRRAADAEPEYDVLADATADDALNDGENEEEENEEEIKVISTSEDFTVLQEQTVRLPCEVSSSSAVIQWFKGNVSYSLADVITVPLPTVSLDGSNLIIKNVSKSDVGKYFCKISTPGKSIEITHTLRLKEPPKIVSISATNRGLIEAGSDLLITCNTTGVPAPSLIWSKASSNDKENVRLTNKEAEFPPNSLLIRKVNRSHTGTYICYASNEIGKPTARHIAIKVLSEPRVHVNKNVVNSAPNITAILECFVHDEPASLIRWYKDGDLIEGDEKYQIETDGQNSNLKVKPKSDSEFGSFTCEAENKFGKHRKSIRLVQYPVIDNLKSEGTKLTWDVHSHLDLEMIELQYKKENETNWMKLPIEIPAKKNRHTYEITYDFNGKDLTPGRYAAQVRAKNSANWSEPSEAAITDLVSAEQYIQHASVYPGSAVRPMSTIFTTFCVFLVMRIL